MKHLIYTISLSIAFVVVCLCTITGMRVWPSLLRGCIAFGLAYAGCLVGAVILFTTYFSNEGRSAQSVASEKSDAQEARSSS